MDFVPQLNYFLPLVLYCCYIRMENRQLHNFFFAGLILKVMIIFFSFNPLCFKAREYLVSLGLNIAEIDVVAEYDN